MQRVDVVSADHPALPGHFPGRPIVPGVLLIDRVAAAVLAEAPGLVVAAVPAAKFLRPLVIAEPFEIVWQRDDAMVSFRCLQADTVVAEGRLLLRTPVVA